MTVVVEDVDAASGRVVKVERTAKVNIIIIILTIIIRVLRCNIRLVLFYRYGHARGRGSNNSPSLAR
jgi:hypothetical protein